MKIEFEPILKPAYFILLFGTGAFGSVISSIVAPEYFYCFLIPTIIIVILSIKITKDKGGYADE